MTSAPTTSIPGWLVRTRRRRPICRRPSMAATRSRSAPSKTRAQLLPKPATPPSASDDEYERQPDDLEEGEGDEPFDDEEDDDDETIAEGGVTVGEVPEEFMDESNPFYAAKKAQQLQAKQGPAVLPKPSFKDTSDAAGDILRRLMERRRAEKYRER